MSRPQISVVVPTRERADTLRYCLRTCIAQDFDNYEVLVCDNHSSPATRQVVDELAHPRLRYIRADRPLGMGANWELAASHAEGEYITFLGDDDALFPFSLRELDATLRRLNTRVLRWQRAHYTWPNIAVKSDANILRVPLARSLKTWDSRDCIQKTVNFEIGADELPMIYTAAVHRSVLEELRVRTGKIFLNLWPDVYSGFAIAHIVGTFHSSTLPFSMAGLSGHSTGVATLATDATNSIAKEFFRLTRKDGIPPHRLVPDVSVWPVTTADSFCFAKDALFPQDDGLQLDRKLLTVKTLEAVITRDPAARARIRSVVRESLTDDPALLAWFDREAPNPPPAELRVFGEIQPGYANDILVLQADRFGIQDVAHAAEVATDVLGLRHRPAQFDLESYPEMLAKIQQAAQDRDEALLERDEMREWFELAEQRCAAAQNERDAFKWKYLDALRDGALRNAPRRFVKVLRARIQGLVQKALPSAHK